MPGTEESRFGFLLNPIKDLTKNWQVDLSKFLGDYLTELADTPITFDGGETVMNFAEAAMLIQGSACVYSRKVEFLWKMVVQMLDLLANKKLTSQQGTKNKKGAADPNETIGFVPADDMPVCKRQMKEETDDKLSVKFLPVTPVCLVDKDKTKKAVPLFSLTGDLLGNKDDYRLNSTMSSVTGMLCTEMDMEALLRHHVKTSFSPTNSPDVSTVLSCAPGGDVSDREDGCPASPPPPSPPPPEQPPSPPPPPLAPETRSGQRQCRRRRQVAPLSAADSELPWKPVNPYEDSGKKRRPFRRGRVTLRPPCLCHLESAANKRKRKLAEPPPEPPSESVYGEAGPPPPLPSVSDYLKAELLTPVGRLTRSQLRHVLPELRPEVLSELQRRKLALADIKQQKRDSAEDEKEPALLDEPAGSDAGSDGGSLAGEPADLPDPADHPADLPPAAAAAPDSYEELVQRRVAEYLSAAQEYVQSTELSRRVARWQESVLPRLEREERRKEFNIHDYGSRILERFPEGGGKYTVPFAEVVRGEEAPEVARYLLSSLMLANTYNVEIQQPGVEGLAMDSMELTLISRKRHHEALDGYHAPSQQSPRRKSQEGGGRPAPGRASSRSPKKAVRKKAAPGRRKARQEM